MCCAEADLVVLALALTPETAGVISATELGLLKPTAWIINVARGAHIVTDDLVEALRDGAIGGAALDVTDPEPVPTDHPLWTMDRCVLTPHVANTLSMLRPGWRRSSARTSAATSKECRSPAGSTSASATGLTPDGSLYSRRAWCRCVSGEAGPPGTQGTTP